MRPPVRRLLLLVALGAASSLSCGRELTAPRDGRVSGPLAFATQFPSALRSTDGRRSSIVDFSRVRVLFERSGGEVAFDKTFEFPSDADSVPLSLSVPIAAGAPETGELLSLTLEYKQSNGTTVFTGGPTSVIVEPSNPGDPPPDPIPVVLRYTGPGEEAVRVVLTPATTTIVSTDQTFRFTTQAFDEFGTLVNTDAIVFESSDTSVFTIDETGLVSPRQVRASAMAIARLFNDGTQSDTSIVNVTLPAASIAAVSGNGQTGVAGASLAQSVVVRVLASDGVPVQGVPVAFAAANGGAPSSALISTNANGDASVPWTLGPGTGTQTMTATAAGLAGSPVTFTATSIAGAPTQLAVTVQPSATVAGQPIAPAVVVQARTAGGLLATGFTGDVTIAIGTNPADANLDGTTTVAAVGGIATFNDLNIDIAAAGYTLVATADGLTSATSAGFTVNAAAAAALAWVQQPAGGTPGIPITPAPSVRAVDAFGNPATFAGAITVSIGANPGGASLGGTTTRSTAANVATFNDLTLSAGGSGYTFIASSAGLTNAVSDPFNIGAATISWANAAGGNWTVAANWSLNRVPTASDVVEISLSGTYVVNLATAANVAGIVLGGGTGTQTLLVTGTTLSVAGDIEVNTEGDLRVQSGTVSGSGSIVIDGIVGLRSSTVNMAIDNQGTLTASGTTALTGSLSNRSSAMLRIAQVDGCCGTANLFVDNGFTNEGTIELTNAFTSAYGAQLTVTNGTLVNAPGGAIWALGGQTPGGTRVLAAQLDNQGILLLRTGLTINRANSAHVNSGAIDIDTNVLTLIQNGSPSSFSTTGNVVMSVGGQFAVTSGALNYGGGIMGGAGAILLTSVNFALAAPFSNTNIGLFLYGATVSGPSTLTGVAGRQIVQSSSTVNAPFVNEGLLHTTGSSAINGAFTTTAGSRVTVAQSDGCCGTAQLTFANGFTNLGLIELSNGFTQNYGAQLTVTSGTLVNAPGATIASIPGLTAGGARVLAAQLDNQGTVTLQQPTMLSRANSAHLNSGTIDITQADLVISQSGAPSSFTNSGSMPLATGRTLSVTGGTFIQSSGTLGGAGTIAFQSVGVTLSTPFTTATTALALAGTTINGTGTLTHAAGGTLSLFSSTINAPFVNDGLLIASGASALGGAVTQSATGTIRVAQLDGCCGTATLTVTNGFTNLGLIELSNQFSQPYGAQLVVVNGTLVNAPAATIASIGGQSPGGGRTLAAQLDNQGTLTVATPLLISRPNSAHQSSGLVDVSGGDLSINQSGGPSSFTNTGTFTVGGGRTLSMSGGSFIQSAGTFGGSGSVNLTSMAITFATPFSNAVTALNVVSSTINGTATVTNATGRTLTLNSSTVNAPFVNDGLLISTGSSIIGGSFTTSAGSTVRVAQLDGCCGTATLTYANGFTNLGLIELSNQFTQPYGAQLQVTNGTLVNAPGATITALGGQTPGGARTLMAELNNQGTLSVATPMSINRANSAHQNTGLIDLTGGGLAVIQSGGPASFTNSGTIGVGAGLTYSVSGGTFSTGVSATISGAGAIAFTSTAANFAELTPAVGSISLNATTATFAQATGTGATAWALTSSTLNSTAPFTNSLGQTFLLSNSTINAPFVNDGTLIASGTAALGGTVTNAPTGVMRIAQSDGCCGTATLTVASGFTNQGQIELSNQFNQPYGAQLNVTTGFLVNATGATISSLGGQTPGGARGINAALNNQGSLIVGVPLTLNAPGADHTSSGLIDVTAADLTITQSGITPTFTNSGSLTLSAGRTLTVTGGAFTGDASGTISGAGNVVLSGLVANFNGTPPTVAGVSANTSTLNFAQAVSTSTTPLALVSSTVNGGQTLTNAAGRTMILEGSILGMPLVNQGTVFVSASSQINAGLTTATTSVIRIGQINGASSQANLTVANGFANNGQIELTTVFAVAYGARLAVTSGEFLNTATGTVVTSDGLTGGGLREIAAPGGVNNQGTITVGPGTAGLLAISGSFQSSGTLNLELGGTVAGTGFDRIAVTGTSIVGGQLNVALINGFTVSAGNTFPVITSSLNLSGLFSSLNLPLGIAASPSYSPTAVTLVTP